MNTSKAVKIVSLEEFVRNDDLDSVWSSIYLRVRGKKAWAPNGSWKTARAANRAFIWIAHRGHRYYSVQMDLLSCDRDAFRDGIADRLLDSMDALVKPWLPRRRIVRRGAGDSVWFDVTPVQVVVPMVKLYREAVSRQPMNPGHADAYLRKAPFAGEKH